MNLTDVDDRTIRAAEEAKQPLGELTAEVSERFMEDLATLGIKAAESYPRASDHAEDMIEITRKLVKSGTAYEKLRSVYFNIGRAEQYGTLSGVDLQKIHLGATVDLDSYEKDDPRDFTLLKRSTLGELKRGIAYKTEWGNVRPGWHVECAAMAMAKHGERADIHVGGVDLIFPHHENEIAICQALTGHSPANVWIHSGLVMVERKKMSRSGGTAVSVRDLLERGYSGRQIRFFLLSTHYRQPLHFSYASLDASCGSLKRLDTCVRNLRRVEGGEPHDELALAAAELQSEFQKALYDDLNISAATGALFHLVRRANRRLARAVVGQDDAARLLEAIDCVDRVLGVLQPQEDAVDDARIAGLVAEREAAREAGDFATADRLRAAIEAAGVVLEDTADGPRIRSNEARSNGN